MTSYAYADAGQWHEISGPFQHQGIQYSRAWVVSATQEQRDDLGFRPIIETDRPTGVRVLGHYLEDHDGEPRRAWTTEEIPLTDLKAQKSAQVDAVMFAKMSEGFPCVLGGNPERLQLRNEVDRTNWLTFHSACRDEIANGNGDDLSPQPIRTQDNVNYSVTYSEGAALMAGLRSWAGAIMTVSWALKDTVKNAPDAAALAAIDLEGAPWP